jgi:hypothetical protein
MIDVKSPSRTLGVAFCPTISAGFVKYVKACSRQSFTACECEGVPRGFLASKPR